MTVIRTHVIPRATVTMDTVLYLYFISFLVIAFDIVILNIIVVIITSFCSRAGIAEIWILPITYYVHGVPHD